ncbi:MAG: S-methyl-5-thioribose-1-phosphate isomerase [Lachnospiraceae bacterium]|nr:S-methyl-5-thioribose-1-phosphate isomerase [Lachnospiraceae bacterium]
MKTGLTFDTVALDDENSALVIIDQTKLPNEEVILHLQTQQEIHEAIYLLQVRGAPAIGVAAAYGVYLAAKEILEKESGNGTDDYDAFLKAFTEASAYLNSARPTAVNLSWALRRMEQVVRSHADRPVPEIVALLKQEAVAIQEEDIAICRSIGEYGLTLIKPGDGILTHCNAGQLATSRYGTATAPMYLGHEKGYDLHVYADETRPLLQGARLTAYELSKAGIDVTLICDNMASTVMKQGKIQAVFVGCDRVAMNGDAANKIGTSGVAILAKHYGIPFYVCAPSSTIDEKITDGSMIPIEERNGEEISTMWYEKKMTADGVKTYNPAFDVTDHELISAIITENGIARAPYTESLKRMLEGTKGH